MYAHVLWFIGRLRCSWQNTSLNGFHGKGPLLWEQLRKHMEMLAIEPASSELMMGYRQLHKADQNRSRLGVCSSRDQFIPMQPPGRPLPEWLSPSKCPCQRTTSHNVVPSQTSDVVPSTSGCYCNESILWQLTKLGCCWMCPHFEDIYETFIITHHDQSCDC